MRKEKKLQLWPLWAFVWILLALSIFSSVLIHTTMHLRTSILYTLIMVGIAMVFSHFLADIALPRFMQKKQYWIFMSVFLFTSFCMGMLFTLFDSFILPDNKPFFAKSIGLTVSSVLITGGICGLRFYKEHLIVEKKHADLQTAHLEAELKLLRDQLNPHFLFNVINSIHVLQKKDPQQASSVLLKFSDMLRHQLYDSSKAYILLSEEIGYIKNYVNVEMVRWGNDINVDCQWLDNTDNLVVAPFILSPFVENAFKHVSRERLDYNFIRITMQRHQQQVVMRVVNSVDEVPVPTGLPGGIGLENVQKRLALLYPGKHELTIVKEAGLFIITLTLELEASWKKYAV
ncbi:histidine kinase [Chitinophaga skermanii]|uniref:Histidine kinase n=1 Tax=Chitinophaga skermanii TaxID=331697 RepID=A0A327Q6A6_9BACT|nr:histidine kinase [Chitinophaga skermanii]RAI98732.1 histidine kinase [Chitinophaga skermanii]